MKLTISASITTLLAIVLAKTSSVEGAWNGKEKKADACEMADMNMDSAYNLEQCKKDPNSVRNPKWCPDCLKCIPETTFTGSYFSKTTCPGENNRRLASRFAEDEKFWSSQKNQNCLDASYDAKVVVNKGHLFFIAEPQDKDSMCPAVAIDNGTMDADHDTIAPHVTILVDKSLGVDGLALDYSLTLGSLSEALIQMNLTKHSFSKKEYNLSGKNCATFLLHLCKEIGLDYHEPSTNANIVNYVGKSLVADEEFIDNVTKAYLEENTGIFQQMKFSVWKYYVGDEGMARALVKNNMDIMK